MYNYTNGTNTKQHTFFPQMANVSTTFSWNACGLSCLRSYGNTTRFCSYDVLFADMIIREIFTEKDQAWVVMDASLLYYALEAPWDIELLGRLHSFVIRQ